MRTNVIYRGDCAKSMPIHIPDESIDLVYMDPPFFSNKNYEVVWGDRYELRAFEDRWKGGIENYIAWMEPKLRECFRVIKASGAAYLHCDWHAVHYLKVLMDRIFGAANFRNEISVRRIRKNVREFKTVKRLNVAYDSILFYAKSDAHRIIPPMYNDPKPERWHGFDAEGLRTGMDYPLFGYKPSAGNHWRWTRERAEKAIRDHKLRANPKTGKPEYLIAASAQSIMPTAWDDISAYSFNMGYPTEKSEVLLERIILMSSNPTEIVLDPFCGCGTAIVVAHKLGRRWIGIDVSPTACKLMAERMRRLGVSDVKIIGMPKGLDEIRALQPFDFQNWVCEKLIARSSERKTGDMGIDGMLFDGSPLQVKQSERVGRNVVDNFQPAMRRIKKVRGIIVAFSFTLGAYEEAARAKNQEGLEIELRTVEEILRE